MMATLSRDTWTVPVPSRSGAVSRKMFGCSSRVLLELASGMVPKGSITVDGVSLTLVDVGSDFFSVALIPYTLSHTTLGERRVGDLVNVEIDLLGKYVRKYLDQIFGAPSTSPTETGLSVARLRELGF